MITHHPTVGSDHKPIILETNQPFQRGKKLFKFESYWAEDEEVRQIVERGWASQVQDPSIEK